MLVVVSRELSTDLKGVMHHPVPDMLECLLLETDTCNLLTTTYDNLPKNREIEGIEYFGGIGRRVYHGYEIKELLRGAVLCQETELILNNEVLVKYYEGNFYHKNRVIAHCTFGGEEMPTLTSSHISYARRIGNYIELIFEVKLWVNTSFIVEKVAVALDLLISEQEFIGVLSEKHSAYSEVALNDKYCCSNSLKARISVA